MSVGRDSLLVIGPQPPPLHGFAAVNAEVVSELTALTWRVEPLDLAPSFNAEFARWIGGRLAAWLQAARRARERCSKGRVRRMYLGLSGGVGQVLDLYFVALARLYHCDLVIHHHSYAYLSRSFVPTRCVTGLAGPDTLHVVLSAGMGHRLQARYRGAQRWLALSNAALLTTPLAPPRAFRALRRIGLLSNLSLEKGVGEFLAILRELRRRDIAVTGVLAGPATDPSVRSLIIAAESEGLVESLGPVSGPTKQAFFEGIDAFVFPTRYRNEAEPLVLHEALRCGLPVIASDRGCIKEMLGSGGVTLSNDRDLPQAAADVIERWAVSPESYQQACAAARSRDASLAAQADLQKQVVFGALTEGLGRVGELNGWLG